MALGCSHQGLSPETQDDEARAPRPPPRPASEGGRRQGARAQESGSSGSVLSCQFLPSCWSQSHSSPRRAAPAGRIKLPLSLTTEPTHGQLSPERPGESKQGGMARAWSLLTHGRGGISGLTGSSDRVGVLCKSVKALMMSMNV